MYLSHVLIRRSFVNRMNCVGCHVAELLRLKSLPMNMTGMLSLGVGKSVSIVQIQSSRENARRYPIGTASRLNLAIIRDRLGMLTLAPRC